MIADQVLPNTAEVAHHRQPNPGETYFKLEDST